MEETDRPMQQCRRRTVERSPSMGWESRESCRYLWFGTPAWFVKEILFNLGSDYLLLSTVLPGTGHRSKSVMPVDSLTPDLSSVRRDCPFLHFTDKEVESQRCEA